MTTNDLREKGCFVFTLLAVFFPSLYIWWYGGPRSLSGIRRFVLNVAWCSLVCFPCGMVIGYCEAMWPYGYDYPPPSHRFRWDLLIRDAAFGLMAAFILGALPVRILTNKTQQLVGFKLPEIGPS